MSANVEAVRAIYATINGGDVEGAFSRAADDFQIDFTRSIGLQAEVFRGREECIRFYADFRDAFEEMGWDLHEVDEPAAGAVVARVTFRGRGLGSGVQTEASGAHLWLLDEQLRPFEFRLYQSHEEAVAGARRFERARKATASRLYFVCDARAGGGDLRGLLEAAIAGGAGVVQLRDKDLDDEALLAASRHFREAANAGGALFILNDRPDLVAACGADGVHVGQQDAAVGEARRIAGEDALVGLSTHTPEQLRAACAAGGATRPDMISVGPIWATPTKPGREPTGLGLIERAAREATIPWFAIGGIDAANAGDVAGAGARRAVVVRAIRDAAEPEAAARAIADALRPADRQTVGSSNG